MQEQEEAATTDAGASSSGFPNDAAGQDEAMRSELSSSNESPEPEPIESAQPDVKEETKPAVAQNAALTELFELDVELRQAIVRSLAREEERLTKRRKDLESDGLKLGVRELDQHLSVISRGKRLLAPQLDAFEQTPMADAIARGESMHAVSEPIPDDDEITLPDSSRLAIDSVIGKGDFPGQFVVVSANEARTIYLEKEAGQWRVVSLALEYPPLAGRDRDQVAGEIKAAIEAGDEGAAATDDTESHIKDAQVSLTPSRGSMKELVATPAATPRKRDRSGSNKPAAIGTVVKKEVAKATGQTKIRPVPKSSGKKRGR